MKLWKRKGARRSPRGSAPLDRALLQSEDVQEKVEHAADDLSVLNAELKSEIAEGVPLTKVEHTLDQSEIIEEKVQEAADELVAVNDAMAEEIDERHRLEGRLEKSDQALSRSRAQERESRHRSLHDAVTGLPNLSLFQDRLRIALAQAQRHGWRLAVMFVDLDDFKAVNDTHGHDAGDRLLLTVANRLRDSVRAGDTVCRRGGDEFLYLMLEAGSQESVSGFATRIGAMIAEPCDVGGGERMSVRPSIGIALYPDDGQLPHELLEHADLAMYTAKEERSGHAFFGRAMRTRPEGR